jgi:hypothetical protein
MKINRIGEENIEDDKENIEDDKENKDHKIN